MSNVTTILHYPNCSTCKKALKWLDAHGVAYEKRHIVDQPPTKDELARLWKTSGLPLKRFFNTSGQSYRGGGFKDRLPNMSEDEQLEALAADGKLIKRPIIDTGATVLIGFKAETYEKTFA